MKKQEVIFFILFFCLSLIFCLNFASFASASTDLCVENSSKIKEIAIDSARNVNSVSIGVANVDESAVLKSVIVKFFINSSELTILNSNSSVQNLNGKNYEIGVISISYEEEHADIKAGGETEEVCLGCVEEIGGIFIKVIDLGDVSDGNSSAVDLLVGSSSIDLSNNNPTQEITFDSQKYTLTLISGSDDSATIQVFCGSIEKNEEESDEEDGEINETEEEPPCYGCMVNSTCYDIGNRTKEMFCSNSTKKFENQFNGGENCKKDYECTSVVCTDDKCKKTEDEMNWWDKFVRWVKRLFGGE